MCMPTLHVLLLVSMQAGSRKNIEEHYDAGNDMYKLFLDESMMYSSAIHAPGEDLHQVSNRLGNTHQCPAGMSVIVLVLTCKAPQLLAHI